MNPNHATNISLNDSTQDSLNCASTGSALVP